MTPALRALPTAERLETWYASRPGTRCLWAYEAATAGKDHRVSVVVMLEPTLDGDETTPTWMANVASWTMELAELFACSVRLERVDHRTELPHVPQISDEGRSCATLRWRNPTCAQKRC